jgi:hypothetical protein
MKKDLKRSFIETANCFGIFCIFDKKGTKVLPAAALPAYHKWTFSFELHPE